MANILGSAYCNKAVPLLGLVTLLLLIQKGDAYEFKVGGSSGWAVPPDPNTATYNQWAERNRFQIGDTLLFTYQADKDSVLQVTKEDYTNCNTAAPLEKFSDGHTVFKFNQSGPYYFISGVEDNCHKNEKLIVVVMADRSNSSSTTNQTSTYSPPPSPSTGGQIPSAAPAGEESPSPPTGSVEINPTPAPSQESSPPPNGASSTVSSFIASIGVFLGSSILLVF